MSWHDEYPRPQLRRNSFFSLNGEWTLGGRRIRVPYPPESALSGFEGEAGTQLDYRKRFSLPEGFCPAGSRVRLHFGAVDQVAEVSVNGRPVARHEGGYLPFFTDITDALVPGENEVSVRATDALSHDYPYGKQSEKRGGMWYTPVSGIWQSVWLEAAPERPIERILIVPDLEGIVLTVVSEAEFCEIEVPGAVRRRIKTGEPARIDIPEPVLWSPDNPHLYALILRTETDCVESYFALRTIRVGRDASGRQRVLLNGEPVFLNGVLDQGYFADGLYLPESPEGYRDDILRMKDMGVNLLRKHIKVEPEAFYYACDRLGMLVMQDMVNCGGYNFLLDTALPTIGLSRRSDRCKRPDRDPAKAFFTRHALDTQAHLVNHPCVIAYTIFNEGWGQFNADMHYELLKQADPTRLYDSASGWFQQKKSDFISPHVYFRSRRLRGGDRPVLLSECGGYARPVEGHMFNARAKYGYGTADTEEALTAKIELMWREMVLPAIDEGLCGLVYTQLSDVEDEINGLYTYDRKICKVDVSRMRALKAAAEERLEEAWNE